MEQKRYALRTFGIGMKQIPGVNIGLTDDEKLLLDKIKEYKRRSKFVAKRLSGENFEIDEELSFQCCSHGWN